MAEHQGLKRDLDDLGPEPDEHAPSADYFAWMGARKALRQKHGEEAWDAVVEEPLRQNPPPPPEPAPVLRLAPEPPAPAPEPPPAKGGGKGSGSEKPQKCPERVMAENFNHPCRVVIVSGTSPPEPAVWHEDRRIWAVGKPALKSAVVKHVHEIERAQQETYSAHYKASVAELVYCETIDNSLVHKGIKFDRNSSLLGLPGGKVADFRNGEIRNARKSDWLTMETSITPEEGEYPAFRKFLGAVTGGRDDLAQYIYRAMGYTLCGTGREEVAFLLKGRGANGKGTLIGVLMDILGSYSALLQPDFFKETAVRRHQTEMAALHRKRLIANPESADGAWNVQRFKTITGERHVMANRMRQDPTRIELDGVLWIGVNKVPMLDGGKAMARRLRVLPFDMRLRDDEIDPALKRDILPSEYPAILYMMIDQATRYRREGLLPEPPCVIRESSEFLGFSAKPLDTWLEETCERDNDAQEDFQALFESAKQWHEEAGHHEPTTTKLGRFLADSDFERERTWTSDGSRTVWKGLRLRPQGYHGVPRG